MNLVSQLHGLMAQGSSALAQSGLDKLFQTASADSDKSRVAGACVVLGAVQGSLTILASILGNSDGNTKTSAQCVNQDTILYAALLAAATVAMEPNNTGNQNMIATRFDHCPESYLRAAEMFHKITGRAVDDALEQGLMSAVRSIVAENGKAGSDLLNQICANQRPI